MKHRLNFAYFTLLPNNIVEVTIDNGIELSLEMVELCHQFIREHISDEFSLLFNNIHEYTLAFEAKLSVASHDGLKAIAFVYYNQKNKNEIEDLIKLRRVDNWNVNIYSGLELGWQEAQKWLNHEMELYKVNIQS